MARVIWILRVTGATGSSPVGSTVRICGSYCPARLIKDDPRIWRLRDLFSYSRC